MTIVKSTQSYILNQVNCKQIDRENNWAEISFLQAKIWWQFMGQTNQYNRDYDNSYKIARLMTKINDNTITSLHMKVTHNQLKVIEYAWGLSQWENLGKTAKNERVYKQVDMSKWRPGYKRGSDYDSGHACKFNKITRNQWESTSNWLSDITLSEWSQNRKK